MLTRRVFFAVATLAVTASFGVVAQADSLANITTRGTIRVAVPQDFPPFGSVGTDMAPQGYDIDVANLIAAKLGVKTSSFPSPALTASPISRPIRSIW